MDTQPTDVLQNRLPNKKLLIIILGVLLVILILILVILQLGKKAKENINKNVSVAPTGVSTGRSTGTSTGTLTKTSVLLTGVSKNLSTTPGQKKIQSLNVDNDIFVNKQLKSQIIDNVLKWLSSMKDERGTYTLGLICESTQKCGLPVKENRVGISVLWGKFKYLEMNNDPNIHNSLNADLSTYANKVRPIQNDFWNCKLMYEINQSKLLTQQEKDNAKKICDIGEYYFPVIGYIDDRIQKNDDSEAELTQLINFPNKSLIMGGNFDPNYLNKLLVYSSASSDYVYRYYWSKNTKDLKTASFLLNFATQIYNIRKSNNSLSGDEWILSTAAIDLYKATNKKIYRDLALNISKGKEEESCLPLFSCIKKAFFYSEYYNLSKDQKYKDYRNEIIRKIIQLGYDNNGFDSYTFGNGAIKDFSTNTIMYLTRDNGLILGLLSILDD